MIFLAILNYRLIADGPYRFLEHARFYHLKVVFLALEVALDILYFSLQLLFLRSEDSIIFLHFF